MPGRFSDLSLPTAALMTPHNVAEPDAANWAVESIKGTTRLFGARKAASGSDHRRASQPSRSHHDA